MESFLGKAKKEEGGKPKYDDPLNQIQDQIGARVIVYYLSDVEEIEKIVLDYFGAVEVETIVPDSEKEFDYEGKHFMLFLPGDVVDPKFPRERLPTFFELQVKTLFQHAWSQADHDLAYKPNAELSRMQREEGGVHGGAVVGGGPGV